MIQVLIFSIIGLILSASLLIQSIIKLSDRESYSWASPLVISSILFIFSFTNIIIVSDEVNSPHDVDVVKGNAIYQENYHVINNDTIKTYTILWRQKN